MVLEKKHHFFLIILTALLLRVAGWIWNDHPWGDIVRYSLEVKNIVEHGFVGLNALGPYYHELKDIGHIPEQGLPPLILVGASFFYLLGADPFVSLKIISLVTGLISIGLAMCLARDLWPDRSPYPVGWAMALSYFLIDHHTNGSVHQPMALGVLLVVFLMMRQKWLWSAFVMGLSWMAHYQATFLAFSLVTVFVLQKIIDKKFISLKTFFLCIVIGLVTIIPNLLYNKIARNDPFYETNGVQVRHKLGVPYEWNEVDGEIVLSFKEDSVPFERKAFLVSKWSLLNVQYFFRQMALLAGLFLPWLWVNRPKIFSQFRELKWLCFISVLFWLLVVNVMNHTINYRYFVTTLPFFLILGLPQRRISGFILVLSVVLVSCVTALKADFRATYYAGDLTKSHVHGNEMEYWRNHWKELKEAADYLKENNLADKRMMSNYQLFYMLGSFENKYILPSELAHHSFSYFADYYKCEYVVCEKREDILGWKIIAQCGGFYIYQKNS